jgi:hypothetical protein
MKKMDIAELAKAYRGWSPSDQRFEALRLDASERGTQRLTEVFAAPEKARCRVIVSA